MKRYSFYALIAVFFGSLLLVAPSYTHAQKSHEVILAGFKQNPPVATSGSGMVNVTLDGDTLQVEGDFSDLISRFSGAYIMVSIKGQGGNQLYRLKVDLNEEKTGATINPEKNRFALSKAEKQLLRNGELYISVSSFEKPQGELRGDIPAMN